MPGPQRSARAGYATDAEGQDGIIAGREPTRAAPVLDLQLSLNSYCSSIQDGVGFIIARVFLPASGSSDER